MLQPPTPPPMTTARASVRIEPLPDQWYRPVEGIYDIDCPGEALARNRSGDHAALHACRERGLEAGLGVLEDERRARRQLPARMLCQTLEREHVALRVGLPPD